jgi:hypothetical protein
MDNIILATTLSTSFIGAIFLLNRYYNKKFIKQKEETENLLEFISKHNDIIPDFQNRYFSIQIKDKSLYISMDNIKDYTLHQ